MNETKAWLPLVTQALPALPDHSVTSAGALTRRGTSKPKCESDGGKKKEILLRSLPSPRPTRTHAETSPGGVGGEGVRITGPDPAGAPGPGIAHWSPRLGPGPLCSEQPPHSLDKGTATEDPSATLFQEPH